MVLNSFPAVLFKFSGLHLLAKHPLIWSLMAGNSRLRLAQRLGRFYPFAQRNHLLTVKPLPPPPQCLHRYLVEVRWYAQNDPSLRKFEYDLRWFS